MKKIKRLICINVPVTACNLKCKYCYITQQKQWRTGLPNFEYSAEHMGKCLSVERLGGVCLINLTGSGETLLPNEIVDIIRNLLQQGHYLEVVTNGTLTNKFEEIARFPKTLLERLEFKFSFHYLELKRLEKIDVFFDNISLVKKAGCSFTVECMPNDELIPHIEDVKKLCRERLGALCQLTVGRNDLQKDRRILTNLSEEEYREIWGTFESDMFNFKMDIFYTKRKEFCYAGDWSLYVNLGNGDAKQCYGQLVNQNIFKDITKPIKFSAVGKYCREPHCYNGHAFLTLGVIPELDTPTYENIRNRKCQDESQWFSSCGKEFFSSKLKDSNKEYSKSSKIINTISKPIVMMPHLIKSLPLVIEKVKRKIR